MKGNNNSRSLIPSQFLSKLLKKKQQNKRKKRKRKENLVLIATFLP